MIDSAVTPAGYSAASGSPDSNAKVAKGANLVGRIGNPSYQPAGVSTVGRIGDPSYQPAEELRLPTDLAGSRRAAAIQTGAAGPGARWTGENGRSA